MTHDLLVVTRATLASAGIGCSCVSVRPSVCPTVRLSQAGVLLKRLNVETHTNNATRWPEDSMDSSFLMPKIEEATVDAKRCQLSLSHHRRAAGRRSGFASDS